MLNFYELIKIVGIENENAINTLVEDIRTDFVNTYKSIQINKTTRKNAITAYSKHNQFFMDKEQKGLYSDSVSTLYVPDNAIITTTKTADIAPFMLEAFKNKRPETLHIKESIALAKCLGWNPAKSNSENPYYICIDDNYYSIALIYNAFNCIADNKKSDGCEVFTAKMNNSNNRYLGLWTKYGTALILPYKPLQGGAIPSHNVDFNYYMETLNEIESYQIEQYKKLA